jgi:DNA-binding beta-propeller fold protein YncE
VCAEFLLVADSNNNRVQVFCASDGVHMRSFGAGDADLVYPNGICVSAGGDRVFVTSGENNKIMVYALQ